MSRTRFLIAGFGSIGRRHFRNLLALGEGEVAFFRTGRSNLPDDELDGFPVFHDLQAAMDWQPQAVIVANPTAHHLDVAIPAARAGCHLLIEKPISHNLERVDELRAAAGGRILVGFQFRFHPSLNRIADLLAEGTLGRPLSFRAHWGEHLAGWHPWEDYRQGYSARRDLGGGVILTLSHPLDYVRWLFGDPAALWAFTGQVSDLGLDVEDTAEIGLRYARGLVGSVHLNYTQQPPRHHLEIVGSRGTLRWDQSDGAAHLYRSAVGDWETYPPPAGFERNHLFLDEMRHFLEVIAGAAESRCTLEDGLKALRLALAALQSAAEGRPVLID